MKKKSGNKKLIVGVVAILVLASVFLWWLGNKVEQIAEESTPDTATTTEVVAPNSLWSRLFGGDNKTSAEKDTELSDLKKNKETKALVPPVVTIKSFQTTNNETTSSIEVYGRQLATVLKPLGTPRPNEAELLLELLETKDKETASKIYQAGKVHLSIYNNLKAMTVPQSAAPLHLKVMKNISKTMVSLGNMGQALDDATIAVSSGLTYQAEALALFNSIAEINNYFVAKGITFTPDDRIVIYINVDDQI